MMRSVNLWDPTSLRVSRWPLDPTSNSVVINIGWVKLPPCQWPKVGLWVAKWLIKEVWANFTFWMTLNAFIAAFDKQPNIRCSTGSISWPVSSRNHNATDQAMAMDRCQTTRCSKDWSKSLFSFYLQILHGAKDFQSSCITFSIFNNSIFFGTTEKTNEN